MKSYILFIDTEASGLPKKWNVAYSQNGNWPYVVQLSWVICTTEGEEVKHEDYYISDTDFKTTGAALRIHGITDEFRQREGAARRSVMSALADDLRKYNPLLVGHFIELDLHLIGAEFFRTGLDNPALTLPSFCTMMATTQYVRNPQVNYLRLGELYSTLFYRKLENQHNSLADARATADCFFELIRRGDITEEKIHGQKEAMARVQLESRRLGYGIPVLLIFLLTVLMAFLL